MNAPTPEARRVVLVACVRSKQDKAAPAAELYCSSWFRKARRYAEAKGTIWYILSALHGVVDPSATLEPYEATLNTMLIAERRAWAEKVQGRLAEVLRAGDRITILAGMRYRELLIPSLQELGYEIEIPLAGLGLGEQLAWLSKATQ